MITLLAVLKLAVLPSLVVAAHLLYQEFMYEPRNVGNRIEDLTAINHALASYHRERGAYPTSPQQGWVGLHNAWGPSQEQWIEGLVPAYLAALPRDPRKNSNGAHQYLYRSDGVDFKILAFYPEDDCGYVSKHRPELLDPIRGGGGAHVCHAYGFWSAGAARW